MEENGDDVLEKVRKYARKTIKWERGEKIKKKMREEEEEEEENAGKTEQLSEWRRKNNEQNGKS